jgi:hypothetical protein
MMTEPEPGLTSAVSRGFLCPTSQWVRLMCRGSGHGPFKLGVPVVRGEFQKARGGMAQISNIVLCQPGANNVDFVGRCRTLFLY